MSRRSPLGIADYRAPALLRDRHLQTLLPKLREGRWNVRFRRETWHTPDDDFVDVDIAAQGARMLLVFHGLEGSSRSHYAQALCAAAIARGWGAAVIHFRGCSGMPNLTPRAYHSGDSDELNWMLESAALRWPGSRLLATGISLGGNVLLKWLGERGDQASRVLGAAVAVSAPHDLALSAASLSAGVNRFYTWIFLRTLKRKSLVKLQRFPGLIDRARLLAARTFFDFDDSVTAPLHGFAGAHDYWQRSSCGPFVGGITVPTLIINARNDPFLPAHALPTLRDIGPGVQLAYPDTGGHVGFFDGRLGPGGVDRFAHALLQWLDDAAR
ncbi:MAG: alpha/beta fold hydrolase [Burkholderiaceae bacterium]